MNQPNGKQAAQPQPSGKAAGPSQQPAPSGKDTGGLQGAEQRREQGRVQYDPIVALAPLMQDPVVIRALTGSAASLNPGTRMHNGQPMIGSNVSSLADPAKFLGSVGFEGMPGLFNPDGSMAGNMFGAHGRPLPPPMPLPGSDKSGGGSGSTGTLNEGPNA